MNFDTKITDTVSENIQQSE